MREFGFTNPVLIDEEDGIIAGLGWSQSELARRLDISVSRLADYESGETRGPKRRPAPIPRVVEFALKYLAGEREPPV